MCRRCTDKRTQGRPPKACGERHLQSDGHPGQLSGAAGHRSDIPVLQLAGRNGRRELQLVAVARQRGQVACGSMGEGDMVPSMLRRGPSAATALLPGTRALAAPAHAAAARPQTPHAGTP